MVYKEVKKILRETYLKSNELEVKIGILEAILVINKQLKSPNVERDQKKIEQLQERIMTQMRKDIKKQMDDVYKELGF
jgi:BMFP domain-containing protein YqiC